MKFTLRDLFWSQPVVAMACARLRERHVIAIERKQLRLELGFWTAGCFLLMLWNATLAAHADDPPASNTRFIAPPGSESEATRDLIDRAATALKANRTATEVLSDGTFLPVRAWPRFRDLLREHAPTGAVTLMPASEPGDLLHVRGTVRDSRGQPVEGALLYVYQTSAKGWYAADAAHIGGMAGDMKHARLFAYLKTDAEGRYSLRTIRPSGYPDSDLPAHIHAHVELPGDKPRTIVTEIRFDDDPRLTEAWRERSHREGCLICKVQRDSDGTQQVVADFTFR